MVTVFTKLLTAVKRIVNAKCGYCHYQFQFSIKKEIVMSSNYHWQKQQTSERIQSRLAEAKIHRSLKGSGNKGARNSSLFNNLGFVPKAVLVGLLIYVGLILLV